MSQTKSLLKSDIPTNKLGGWGYKKDLKRKRFSCLGETGGWLTRSNMSNYALKYLGVSQLYFLHLAPVNLLHVLQNG